MPATEKERQDFKWLPKTAVTYTGNNQSDVVFFIVNVKLLFNVDLNYPGIKSCLNAAFNKSKHYVPRDTGLTLRSYKSKILDDNRIMYFFDPNDIVGKMRKGEVVKEYYVKYIAESAKNFNWLTMVMNSFYETLWSETKKLAKKQGIEVTELKPEQAISFMNQMRIEYKTMKEERDLLIEQQKASRRLKEVQIKLKKEELLAKKKARESKELN